MTPQQIKSNAKKKSVITTKQIQDKPKLIFNCSGPLVSVF